MALGIGLPTWRILGLGVAAAYAHLGVLEMVCPWTTGREVLLPGRRRQRGCCTAADKVAGVGGTGCGEDEEATAATAAADPVLTPLLGARELGVAAALVLFHHARWDRQSGWLIVSGVVPVAAELYVVFKRKGAKMGAMFTAGGAAMMLIGWGLIKAACEE